MYIDNVNSTRLGDRTNDISPMHYLYLSNRKLKQFRSLGKYLDLSVNGKALLRMESGEIYHLLAFRSGHLIQLQKAILGKA